MAWRRMTQPRTLPASSPCQLCLQRLRCRGSASQSLCRSMCNHCCHGWSPSCLCRVRRVSSGMSRCSLLCRLRPRRVRTRCICPCVARWWLPRKQRRTVLPRQRSCTCCLRRSCTRRLRRSCICPCEALALLHEPGVPHRSPRWAFSLSGSTGRRLRARRLVRWRQQGLWAGRLPWD